MHRHGSHRRKCNLSPKTRARCNILERGERRGFRVNTSIVAVSWLLNVYERENEPSREDIPPLSLSLSPLLELARNFHPSDSAKISPVAKRESRGESNNGGARAPGIISSLCRGSVYYFYRRINVFTRALHRSQQGVSTKLSGVDRRDVF